MRRLDHASSRLPRWLRLARWPEWSTSKLPYLGAAAFLLTPREASPLQVVGIMGAMACCAAFGYAINEVADRETDVRAGKSNRATDVAWGVWASFLAITGAGAVFLATLWGSDTVAPALVLGDLVFAAAYSLPPIRLKERGVVGLIAGAAAQWAVPTLAISASQPGGWSDPTAWCASLLGLAIGLRWMAVHQLQDRFGDRQAGVRTYAAEGGTMWPVVRGAFLGEVVLLSALFALRWPHSLPAIAVLGFWIVQATLLRPPGGTFRQRLEGYDHAPLAEFYFLLLPVTLALGRVGISIWFLVIASGFVVLGRCYLEMMIGEWLEVGGVGRPR